jgi:hypothetical protein
MFNAVQMSYRCGSEHKLEAAASLKEDPMTRMTLSKIAALMVCVPGFAVAQPIEKRGTTPYVTHFIFRPLMSIDIPGLGTATNLEAVGTTQNMKGEKMLDKMSARCAALSVASPSDGLPVRHPLSLAGERERSARSWSTRSECGAAANEGGRP